MKVQLKIAQGETDKVQRQGEEKENESLRQIKSLKQNCSDLSE